MSRSLTAVDSRTAPAQGAAWRLAALVALSVAAFRDEYRFIGEGGIGFSDWSHLLALPVAIAALCWCRRAELSAALAPGGSPWGLVTIVLGALIWFAAATLGLFGHLKLASLLIVLAGAVLATCGAAVARICLPVFLMIATCLPLSERTMESASIPLQRVSLRGAALLLKAVPGMDASMHGMTLAYRRGETSGEAGLGEQRFGFRLAQAAFLVGLFTVFCRRRPFWQIAVLAAASVPLVMLSNVIRIASAALVSACGDYPPVSAVPRNVSLAAALVAAYVLFALACRVADGLGRMVRAMFFSEGEPGDDVDPVGKPTSPAGDAT